MKGNHPKRRKDKYNPYSIFESDGKYYIEFADGQRKDHCMEISRELYEAFDRVAWIWQYKVLPTQSSGLPHSLQILPSVRSAMAWKEQLSISAICS